MNSRNKSGSRKTCWRRSNALWRYHYAGTARGESLAVGYGSASYSSLVSSLSGDSLSPAAGEARLTGCRARAPHSPSHQACSLQKTAEHHQPARQSVQDKRPPFWVKVLDFIGLTDSPASVSWVYGLMRNSAWSHERAGWSLKMRCTCAAKLSGISIALSSAAAVSSINCWILLMH
jgi:hypothetical protein